MSNVLREIERKECFNICEMVSTAFSTGKGVYVRGMKYNTSAVSFGQLTL